MKQFLLLMRWHRPIGFFLLLWPVLWALWVASDGFPEPKIAIIFIMGTWVMRSAGCVINDWADRKFDPAVSRTAERPIAAGQISSKQALVVFLILGLIAFCLVLQLNLLTIQLSVVALGLAIIYPFTKRFIYFPQLILGIAFAWAIPMVFAAVQNHLPREAWLLFLVAVLWPIAYDTIYAMIDREEDQKIGVKSLAIWLGKYDRYFIAVMDVAVLCCLFYLGILKNFSPYYYFSLGIAAIMFAYQLFLIREADAKQCLKAFKNNGWVGCVIFVGFLTNAFN